MTADATRLPMTTADSFPDRDVVETLGVARGNSVRARNVGRDLTQSLRNLVGGELKAYSRLMSDTRDQAIDRMLEDAAAMDADAVVNVRFQTSRITKGGAELLAYGTAVRLE